MYRGTGCTESRRIHLVAVNEGVAIKQKGTEDNITQDVETEMSVKQCSNWVAKNILP